MFAILRLVVTQDSGCKRFRAKCPYNQKVHSVVSCSSFSRGCVVQVPVVDAVLAYLCLGGTGCGVMRVWLSLIHISEPTRPY